MAGNSRPGGVKFVEHDAAGLPVKRKQVHQACLPCRKRKKRCHHVQDASAAAAHRDQDHDISAADERRPRSAPTQTGSIPDRDTSDAAAQLLRFFHHASDNASDNASTTSPDDDQKQQTSPAPPFVGDLNPEGILIEAAMAPAQKTTQTDEDPDHQIVGFLPPTSPRQSRVPPAQHRRAVSADTSQPKDETPGPYFSVPRRDGTRLMIHVQDTAKFASLAQTLVNRGLADKVMPSDTEWSAMKDIYLAKIHPIFPIFEQSTLMNLPEQASLRELVQASVCLAMATDPDARGLLTFKSPTDGRAKSHAVSYDDYSREMANFINRRLTELQEAQQISLTYQIQVMALTCLYWQPADPVERFAPLTLYAKLVSLVHTHGVHLGLLARIQPEGSSERLGTRLFKCLYALDRLLGTMYARPVMFHNVDLIQVPRPDATDSPIFRLFMALIHLLDQVIEMYRAHPKVSYVDIPVFERMAIDAGAQCEPESLLVTLEVLYHAIGVLSVRMPRHRFRTAPECDTLPGPRTQHLPPSSVNARRSHSADRILDVIQDYKLSPFPFVPYALTLSLSVAYRKWRFSQLPMFRTRGGADFKKVLPVLQGMAEIWSSARINGQLGQAVVLKLDRGELLNRRRTERSAEAGRTRHGQPSAGAGKPAAGGLTRASNDQGTANPSQQTVPPSSDKTTTSPGVPCSPRIPPEVTQTTAASPVGANGSLAPPSLRGRLQSTAPSSLADRPQQQPPPPVPTWTATWTVDNAANNTNIPPTQPWPAPALNGTTPHTSTLPHQPDTTASGYPYAHMQSDDQIPLPGDLVPQTAGINDTSPLAGMSEGNLDDFLGDDDALFRSWDPRFAQSVDFSFCSILDPGNPFAWPEYGSYTGAS